MTWYEIRLALFRLLQAAYAAPPTPELAVALAEAAAAYDELIQKGLPPIPPVDPVADTAEFHRLFVGPDRLVAPPYESVYRSPNPLLMQPETLAVRSQYQAHGLAVEPGQPEDHLATELAFYAILQERGLTAAQRSFYQEHLQRWVGTFCNRVIAGSRSPFYQALAIITNGVIAAEEEVLAQARTEGGVQV